MAVKAWQKDRNRQARLMMQHQSNMQKNDSVGQKTERACWGPLMTLMICNLNFFLNSIRLRQHSLGYLCQNGDFFSFLINTEADVSILRIKDSSKFVTRKSENIVHGTPLVLFCQITYPTWIGYECKSPSAVLKSLVLEKERMKQQISCIV